MVATALLLFAAFVLSTVDSTAAFQPSAFTEMLGSSASASGSGDGSVDYSSLLRVMPGFETNCTSAPFIVGIVRECAFFPDECTFNSYDESGNPSSIITTQYQCGTDVDASVEQLFKGKRYLRLDEFVDEDCTAWSSTVALAAGGKCHEQFGKSDDGDDMGILTVINANGSASWVSFRGNDCSEDVIEEKQIDAQQLSSNACVNKTKWYTNAVTSNKTEGSDNSGPRSVGGAVSQIVVASITILVAAFAF